MTCLKSGTGKRVYESELYSKAGCRVLSYKRSNWGTSAKDCYWDAAGVGFCLDDRQLLECAYLCPAPKAPGTNRVSCPAFSLSKQLSHLQAPCLGTTPVRGFDMHQQLASILQLLFFPHVGQIMERELLFSWLMLSKRHLDSLFVLHFLTGKKFFREAEIGQIADAHRIKYPVEMVAFMLHDARVEPVHRAV
jgi:hypothetical protein